jgi:hypothetical protein
MASNTSDHSFNSFIVGIAWMTSLATTTTSELALLVRLLLPPPETFAILVIDAGGSQIAFAFGQWW